MDFSNNDINAVLKAEDIEGYLEFGAPEDEHASEAEEIASVLAAFAEDQCTEENIVAVISTIWMNNFNLSEQELKLRLPAIRRIAHRIL